MGLAWLCRGGSSTQTEAVTLAGRAVRWAGGGAGVGIAVEAGRATGVQRPLVFGAQGRLYCPIQGCWIVFLCASVGFNQHIYFFRGRLYLSE